MLIYMLIQRNGLDEVPVATVDFRFYGIVEVMSTKTLMDGIMLRLAIILLKAVLQLCCAYLLD